MFSYFAYGLRIRSEVAIPDFIEEHGEDYDVAIRLKTDSTLSDYLPEEVTEKPLYLKLTRESALFYAKGMGIFLVEGGCHVTIICEPSAPESLLRFYLVGTIMGIVLYQRGLFVLHASAVAVEGEAVLFLGASGEGKSSTAAAFHHHCYRAITDDVAPVNMGSPLPTVAPGFPQIKLSLEVATALGEKFDTLLQLHPSALKRGYRFEDGFLTDSLPIKCIYVLNSSSDFSIEPLSPQEAVVELSRHSRPSTLFHKPDAQHFLQCVALVRQHTVYRLNRPRNLTLLPRLIDCVEAHLSHKEKSSPVKAVLSRKM